MTYNKIFDWFETTRWDWTEINFDSSTPSCSARTEVDFLTEAAIIEFGTLPGVNNSPARVGGRDQLLLLGADVGSGGGTALPGPSPVPRQRSAIKSPLQARPVQARSPTRSVTPAAGTLMMNIISEARAAELYHRLAAETRGARDQAHLEASRARRVPARSRVLRVHRGVLQDAASGESDRGLEDGIRLACRPQRRHQAPGRPFYPHSTSAKGRPSNRDHPGGTPPTRPTARSGDGATAGRDDSIESPRDLKGKLRSLV